MSTELSEGEPQGVQQAVPQTTRKRTPMSVINLILDTILLLAIVVVMWLATLLQVVFPRPTKADNWMLWGMSYDQWHNVLFIALCACALIALEHLVLHWSWVCNVISVHIFRNKGRADSELQAVYGVGTFIGILGVLFVLLVIAYVTVQRPLM